MYIKRRDVGLGYSEAQICIASCVAPPSAMVGLCMHERPSAAVPEQNMDYAFGIWRRLASKTQQNLQNTDALLGALGSSN